MRRPLAWYWWAALLGLTCGCREPSGTGRSVNPEGAAPEAGVTFEPDPVEAGPVQSSSASSSARDAAAHSSSSTLDSGVATGGPDAGTQRKTLWGLQPGNAPGDAGVLGEAWAGLEVTALGSRIVAHVSRSASDDFSALRALPEMSWIVTLAFDAWQSMDDAQLSAWLDRAWSHGPQLRYLVFGHHLETDIVNLPLAEQAGTVARLESTLILARDHARKPPESGVGLGVTNLSFVPTKLLTNADFIAFAYGGLDFDGNVSEPESALKELTSRIESLSDKPLPVVIQDLAYPSGAGEERQLAFYSALRRWFEEPKSPDVLAVVISSLYSPDLTDCEAWAADWDIHEAERLRCSVGLRTPQGLPKPALSEVTELLAQFAQL